MMDPIVVLSGISTAFFSAGFVLLVLHSLSEDSALGAKQTKERWGNTPRILVLLARPFLGLASNLLEDLVSRSDKLLRLAGSPNGGISGIEHTALSLLFGLAASIVSAGAMMFQSAQISTIVSVAVLCPVLSVLARQLAVQTMASDRVFELRSTFPYFLDMMVLTLRAGATPPMALNLYIESSSKNALTVEISRMRDETKAGALFEDALLGLADRMHEKDLHKVIMNIKHGMRTGSLADVLAAQAEDIRFVRTQAIEREIERMRVSLNLPLVLMLIGSLGLIMGPAFVTMAESPLL